LKDRSLALGVKKPDRTGLPNTNCVSDNSYFNELNAYDDTEKGNWRRRGVGEVLAAVNTVLVLLQPP